MRRSGVVLSLSLLAGCSFVDDFDKFQAEIAPGRDDGSTPGDDRDARVENDANKPSDGATPRDADPPPVRDAQEPPVEDANMPPVQGNDAGSDAAPNTGVCGDMNLDPGEMCDDGNNVPGDGCEPGTCTVTVPVTCAGMACDDGDVCTANACELGACKYTQVDRDGDGYSPGRCALGSAQLGNDCNDNDAKINPKAVEVCDNVDNNCNGMVDEGFTKVQCYPDLDGDGFANLDGVARSACTTCPPNTIAVANPRDRTRHDCYDEPAGRGADVYPGQMEFDDQGYGQGGRAERKFDFNCDGVVEPQWKAIKGMCGGLLGLTCDATAGYAGKVPDCGESGDYQICGMSSLSCEGRIESRKQSCR